ncbi:MAG TPA: hypothetical protein VN837_02640 [Chloroflexota bacterium]|nr:hypothetical protein [Chloroflexota bacterium]
MVMWWDQATNGHGAWAREARRAMAAAAERRVKVKPEELISWDVRDLQAMTIRLREGRHFRWW